MDKKVLSVQGKEVKDISLNDSVFNREVSEGAVYHAIRNELANLRQGTASTKTRSEVRGSHRKLWKQKGTGRARMGTRQSPVWVGGGAAFGPRPRDYSYKMPRKLKRLAFKSILSMKNQNDSLIVVEDFDVENGKTKNLAGILSNLGNAERTVLIVKDEDKMIKRAGKNIPWLTTLSYNKLRAHDLFYGKKVVVLESAALKLNDFYSDEPAKAAAK
ncbi:50S ribosomal protein L4 [Salinispira pacifica]|uniref:Large ribosomal subunit protein uL4 n=1 Tax=Salinispira pacifica TaxID=1307761 RepID=V5WEQ3_9SPIO|nr:50S ribosomal protein L4 [Salinispira pacifica]AHC14298.1 LSU ribosomal protein L4p (L1e) [Salinispira pacifica]